MAKTIVNIDGENEDWSQSDWEEYLEERAEKIAEQRMKANRKRPGYVPHEGDQEKYAAEYKRRMLARYPFDKLDSKVYAAFENLGDESAMKWLDGWKEYDPMLVKQEDDWKEWSKYLPGIAAEGEDWNSWTPEQLKDVGAKMGFDTDTPEGRGEFLNTLAGYQLMLDRANQVKELRDMPGATVTSIAFPTLSRAIEDAVAEGKDLSKGKATALGILDALVNSGQFMAPSANVLRSRPIVNGLLDAAMQGGLEAGRQAGGDVIADVAPDYVNPPVVALTAGATRPAMIGTAQGLLSGFTGPEMMKVRRGLMASTRAGNPVYAERDALEKSVDQFNTNLANNMVGDLYWRVYNPGNSVDMFLSKAEKNAALRANLGKQLAKEIEASPISAYDILARNAESIKSLDAPPFSVSSIKNLFDKDRNLNEALASLGAPVGHFADMLPHASEQISRWDDKVFLDKDAILAAYDKLNPRVSVHFDPEGIATVNKEIPRGQLRLNVPEGAFPMGGEQEQRLASLIPAKSAELDEMDRTYRRALTVGTLLGDFGGRFEPTFKFNLLNPVVDSPFSEKNRKEGYKKSSWYSRLDARSKEIIDEAFKRKDGR